MPDEYQEKIKYTVDDADYVQRGLAVVCETYARKKAMIKSTESGNFMELKPHTVTKKLMEFLGNEGLEIEYQDVERRKGVKQIAGVSVNVSPVTQNSYDAGFFFTFLASGDTKESMQADYEDKKYKIFKEFTNKGIPMDRICLVSLGECLHDFSVCEA